jgi:glycosyltransferase involved in cell wall biosynthesis
MIGGAEKSVQSLAETLVAMGFNVVVASLSQHDSAFRKQRGVTVYDVPLKNVYWPFGNSKNEISRLCWHLVDIYNPSMSRQVTKIVRRERPDIIHTHNLSGFSVSIWKLASKLNVPLLHTVRDYYLLCHLSTMYRNDSNCLRQCFRCRLFSHFKKYLSCLPNTVTGISQFILDRHLDSGFFPNVESIHVIPNGYGGINRNIQRPRSKNLRLGYLGRISAEKGIETLLENVRQLNSRGCELHIGGTGRSRYVSELKRQYRDRVSFHGFVEPQDFFGMIDALIVPSLWNEPFGRTIIEAYYYGVPVIGSRRGGIRELIDEGKTGYLYDPNKSDSLMDVVAKFGDNQGIIMRMQDNCFAHSRKYTPENITAKYVRLYETMLGSDHRRN